MPWPRAFAVLLASAILAHAPGILFDVGVRNNDFNAHYHWAIQFAAAIRDGDPYPHWMWRGNLGLGEVALLFYSPLFYYACSFVRLLTSNTWEAMRLVFVLSTLITGYFGWRLFRLFTSDAYALVGAILLQWTPMIFMLFYYFNGFPWAVGFAALVALTYYALRPGSFERWIDLPVSLAVAALVLTHILSALMALVCFSCMWLRYLGFRRNGAHTVARAVSWFVSAGFGLALAGFYLVPALGSMHLISSAVWTTTYTPWSAFAFPTITTVLFGMRWFSFQWTVPAIALLCVAAATWHAYRNDDMPESLREVLLLLLVVSWASLFLTSELSYPLWLLNTPLRMVQFPHRFIYVTSATGLAANVLALWDQRRIPRPPLRKLATALPLILSIAATGLLSAKMLLVDGKPHHLSIDETMPYAGEAEYRLTTQADHWKDYYTAGGLAAECAGKMLDCRTITADSRYQAWSVSGSRPAHLRLPLLAFPAWQVTVDGAAAATAIDPVTGLISVDLPAGTHRVAAVWKRMGVERAGLAVTVFAVLVLAFLAFRQKRSLLARPV
ncbi:MAG TPA: 6-pyruvoyl-tetrahydropterin synthase-related protein [Stellaceae bacterium]|nr:6-pyruvoyl-tetrahydropterin synthase-related protein [Stellaceae bacterium]